MPRLPSRYEDLDEAFRSRLRPNSLLLDTVKKAYAGIKVSGGIRFLPIYGKSGCGKSCATLELNLFLPECKVIKLPLEAVANHRSIEKLIPREHERLGSPNLLITIVDQYEEQVVQRTEIPSQFIEALSLLDRGQFRNLPTLFLWLTTSQEFRDLLVVATRRNSRILVEPNSMEEFKVQYDIQELKLAGIVFNAITDYSPEEIRSREEVKKLAKKNGWYIFSAEIKYSRSYPKGAREGKPIFRTSYSRTDQAIRFRQFAEEFAERVNL